MKNELFEKKSKKKKADGFFFVKKGALFLFCQKDVFS